MSFWSLSMPSRYTDISVITGWIFFGLCQACVHICILVFPVSCTHFYAHTLTQPVSLSDSQGLVQFCSVPVSSKLILLAKASGETSFSGRTWCIVLMILSLFHPISFSLSLSLSPSLCWPVRGESHFILQRLGRERQQRSSSRQSEVDHTPFSTYCSLSLSHTFFTLVFLLLYVLITVFLSFLFLSLFPCSIFVCLCLFLKVCL